MGSALLPIVQESCAFYDDHVLYSDWDGLILEGAKPQDSRCTWLETGRDPSTSWLIRCVLWRSGVVVHNIGPLLPDATSCQRRYSADPFAGQRLPRTTVRQSDGGAFSFEILSDMVMSEESDVLGNSGVAAAEIELRRGRRISVLT